MQSLLKTLTRKDLTKVFKRKKLGAKILEQPVYKFMTDEELQEALSEANDKANEMLQMPPVLLPRKPIDRVLSNDPALQGLETARFVFTDITFGVPDSRRLIVVRDTDGKLREADWDTRDRMNQLYFPKPGRELKIPTMFQDSHLDGVLSRKEYVFILDRACIQFEPDDAAYQRICGIVYECVNHNGDFEILRSTRHFGPFVFYLAWHREIDNLLLELIETCQIDEANKLIVLYGKIHKVQFDASESKDASLVQEYITKHSNKKGALELALQAFKDYQEKKTALEEGIQVAHGH